MLHEWGACQPLRDRLSPFYYNTLDFVLLQKRKDLLRDIVGGVGGGRTGHDTNPDNDRTKNPVLLLSRRTVRVETDRVNGQPLDVLCLDDFANMGTDSTPDLAQRGTEDSAQ